VSRADLRAREHGLLCGPALLGRPLAGHPAYPDLSAADAREEVAMRSRQPTFALPRSVRTWALALLVLGGLTFLGGVLLEPQRTWANVLLVSYYLLGLGLAGVVFVALLYVTGAGWAVALRRVPEAMAALIPVGALGLALVFLARPSLYPWTAPVAGP